MKIKYLVIVSLILAILTIGVVSASDDFISDDGNITASLEDSIVEESSMEEVELSTDDDVDDVVGEEKDLIKDYDYDVCVEDYLEGESVYFSGHLPKDASGTVNLTIDDNDEYARGSNIYEGGFSFYISEMPKGKYNAKITYDGDEKYAGFAYEKEFTVDDFKVNIPYEYFEDKIYDGDLIYLIEVVEGFEGNVSIYFDDKLCKSGVASELVKKDIPEERWVYYIPVNYIIQNLPFGMHTYKVVYVNGDNELVKTGSFNKSYYLSAYADPEVYMERQIYYGDEGVLYISAPVDGNGKLHVTVNGKTEEYDLQKIENNKIKLTDLIYGKNQVTVTYSDDHYPLKTISADFDYIGVIDIPIYYIFYNNGENISLLLPADAVGELCIYKLNEDNSYELIGNASVVDGKAIYPISRFDLGTHKILAKYENGNYYVEDAEKEVNICPNVIYPMTVHVDDEATLVVEVPETATGNFTVGFVKCIFDSYYEDSEIITLYSGQIQNLSIPLNTSEIGTYRLLFDYPLSQYIEYLFYVVNVSSAWELNVSFPNEIFDEPDYIYPVLKYPAQANGKFVIYIDGKEKWSNTVSRYGLYVSIWTNNLACGIHTWRVEYSGDSYFDDAVQNGTFSVTYFVSAIMDGLNEEENIPYKENHELVVYFHNPVSGTVDVLINGTTYHADVVEGRAVLSVPLAWGENIATISYSGDDDLPGKEFNATFNVCCLSVISNCKGKELESISLIIPGNATGNLVVELDDGNNISVPLENGKAIISSDKLPIGCYRITARYDGADHEVESYSGYVSVTPKMNISAEILDNEDCLIEINLPDSNSTIDIYIDDELNGTYAFKDGKLNVTIPNLSIGAHIITFNYNGDDYNNLFKYCEEFEEEYYAIQYNVEVKDHHVDPNFAIKDVADVEQGKSVVVEISAVESFSGDVKVQVGEVNTTATIVDGKGNVTVSTESFAVGAVLVKVSSEENDAFLAGNAEITFNVTAKQDIGFGNGTGDKNGTNTNGTNKKPVTPPKTKITLTLKKVKVKKSAKKLVLRATLKINGKYAKKGTKVVFKFKGKKYTAKVKAKGVAKVTIKKKVLKKLKVGKKVKYQVSYGKKTVKKTVKVKK